MLGCESSMTVVVTFAPLQHQHGTLLRRRVKGDQPGVQGVRIRSSSGEMMEDARWDRQSDHNIIHIQP